MSKNKKEVSVIDILLIVFVWLVAYGLGTSVGRDETEQYVVDSCSYHRTVSLQGKDFECKQTSGFNDE